MTREEIISGLKFTVEMFLFDPSTGEKYTEPRNDMDKTTIDACRGAIELLEKEPCEDCISRQAVFDLMRSLTRWCVRSEDGKFNNVGLLYDDVMFGIDKLPSVIPQPKAGHWINDGLYAESHSHKAFHCSKCGHNVLGFKEDLSNYCPNCGCTMKGE